MKSFLPLLSLSLLVASCTTAYKTGQTPDDVYFSPEHPQEEYVRVEKSEDRQYRSAPQTRVDDYYNYEDSYLRMKVRNRNRWVYLDNDFYSYNPYAYRYYNNSFYYNSPWNSYSYWNYYYNPYAPQVIVLNPKSTTVSRPRTINLRTFYNPTTTNTQSANPKNQNYRSAYDGSNSNSRPRRDIGNDLRNIFSNSGSSNNNSYSTPSRSSSSSSNSSSSSGSSGSSGGSSGGSAPARRF